jgi:hypothetical protein
LLEPGFRRLVLLLAARKPSVHRCLISFAARQSLARASVMTIQNVQASEARRSSSAGLDCLASCDFKLMM